jgi:hypothetical protein
VLSSVCQQFMAANPQWGGNLGHQCAEGLCTFSKCSIEPSITSSERPRQKQVIPYNQMEGLNFLKNLCCQKIIQHGGGLTAEDRRKTEIASSVLKCCCKIQADRGLDEVSVSGRQRGNTEDDGDDRYDFWYPRE